MKYPIRRAFDATLLATVTACTALLPAGGSEAPSGPKACQQAQADPVFSRHLEGECSMMDTRVSCSRVGLYGQIAEACGDDLLSCRLMADAASGKTSDELATMIADFLRNFREPWGAVCDHRPTEGELLELGILAAGISGETRFHHAVAQVGDPAADKEQWTGMKQLVVDALFWIDPSRPQPIAALLTHERIRVNALMSALTYLGLAGSDAGLAVCADDHYKNDRSLAIKCAEYAARIDATGMIDDLVYRYAGMRAPVERALGLMKAKEHRALLAKAAANGSNTARVALMNLGDTAIWDDFAAQFDNPRSQLLNERLEELAWLTNQELVADKALPLLRRFSAIEEGGARRDRDRLSALVVRAQLGDDSAVPDLVEILTSGDNRMQRDLLRGLGGAITSAGGTIGLGYVADQRILDALLATWHRESSERQREALMRTYPSLRSIMRLRS